MSSRRCCMSWLGEYYFWVEMRFYKNMITFSKTSKEKAFDFIFKYHYSNVMPKLNKVYLLVTEDGKELWIVTLWWGTQPLWTINKLFPDDNLKTTDYFEIGKMCFIPECNESNFWSRIISELIKYLKKEYKDLLFLYTLADWIMWKPWYVYQASNFVYIGSFDTLVYLNISTWEKIHPRTAKSLCQENARFLGKEKIFWLTYDFMETKWIQKIQWKMFRYIYPLNKRAKKLLSKYPYWKDKRPKKDDIKWFLMESGKKTDIPMPQFNMDITDWYNRKNIQQFNQQLLFS